MPRHPHRSDDRLTRSFVAAFPACTEAVPGARRDFTRWLDDSAIDGEVGDDLAVVFSELAANAVDGSPDRSSEVCARAWLDGSDVVLEVVNPTSGAPQIASTWDLEDPLRTGGRGLMIVHAFMDDVDVEHRAGDRIVVRCRRSTCA